MVLDPNLLWAFRVIGITFLLYGFDKIVELLNPKIAKVIKTIVGIGYFGFGILIFLITG